MKNYAPLIYFVFFALQVQAVFCDVPNIGNIMHDTVSVTVFVHGIMSIKHFLTPSNVVSLMYDNVRGSSYHQSLDIIRENPLFYQNQAMQQYGLHPIDKDDIRPGNASGAIASLLELVKDNPIPSLYYTFGWEGIISAELRSLAGQKLYTQLAELVSNLKETYKSVQVKIYGFSHGGNVAMNIAKYQSENPLFTVNELVLIGTPIQTETDYCIADPIFEKVYNVFSPADRIQSLDCFSFKRFFSSKTFKSRQDFALPKKLTQIQLRITEPVQGCKNIEKIDPHNPLVASGRAAFLRDRSPGHAELWFLGWTPQYYRSNFPLYPLPAMIFIPKMLADTALEPLEPDAFWIADLRPSSNYLILRKPTNNYANKIIYFEATLIEELKKHAQQFEPENLTQKQYDQITYQAIRTVREKSGKTRLYKKPHTSG